MGAADEKLALRGEMRRKRSAVTAERRAECSSAICRHLAALPLGRSVAVYLAGADEIDLAEYVSFAHKRGISLYAPRWNGCDYRLAELKEPLREGPHGIREPAEGTEVSSAEPSAWLVPGLAFGVHGERLGYGGGWYDRLLAGAAPDAVKLGIAYSFQVVGNLPTEPHDMRLDGVVTERGKTCAG